MLYSRGLLCNCEIFGNLRLKFYSRPSRDNPPLAQTDMYFVTFESCNPTIGSHWLTHTMKITVSLLLADTVCKHSHSLLLLVQHKKLVTTAHEQCAMTRGAGWEHNFCQFERGVCPVCYLWYTHPPPPLALYTFV